MKQTSWWRNASSCSTNFSKRTAPAWRHCARALLNIRKDSKMNSNTLVIYGANNYLAYCYQLNALLPRRLIKEPFQEWSNIGWLVLGILSSSSALTADRRSSTETFRCFLSAQKGFGESASKTSTWTTPILLSAIAAILRCSTPIASSRTPCSISIAALQRHSALSIIASCSRNL